MSSRERENLTLSDREQVEDGCLGETKKRYPEYFIPNPTNSDIEKIEKCAFDGPAGFPGNTHFHERNFVDQSGSFWTCSIKDRVEKMTLVDSACKIKLTLCVVALVEDH